MGELRFILGIREREVKLQYTYYATVVRSLNAYEVHLRGTAFCKDGTKPGDESKILPHKPKIGIPTLGRRSTYFQPLLYSR